MTRDEILHMQAGREIDTWRATPERRRPALLRLLDDLTLIAMAFINPMIDGLTDRDYVRQAAAHNTAMAMDTMFSRVVSAYFFVHQPQHWRGETYHPGAVAMFRKMTFRQAQAYLDIFRSQYEAAVRKIS